MREQWTMEAWQCESAASSQYHPWSFLIICSYHWVFGHLLSLPAAGRLIAAAPGPASALPWKLLFFQQLMKSAEGRHHILFGPIFGTGWSQSRMFDQVSYPLISDELLDHKIHPLVKGFWLSNFPFLCDPKSLVIDNQSNTMMTWKRALSSLMTMHWPAMTPKLSALIRMGG